MMKICFFVPINSAEKVKALMFKAGAGKIGNYDSCCFETKGIGQFRPLDGSNPSIGEQNRVEKVDELKIEMVCEDSRLRSAVTALKDAHPYETPAYEVYKLENI